MQLAQCMKCGWIEFGSFENVTALMDAHRVVDNCRGEVRVMGGCLWCGQPSETVWQTLCGPELMCRGCAETRRMSAQAELEERRRGKA